MKAQRLFAGFICSLMFSISTLLAQINVESHWPGGRCQAIALNDEYALATFGSFLYVLRLEDYQEIATLQLPDVVSDITIEASTAYMAARAAGIFVVDLSNPQQPAMVARVGDYTRGVHVDGQHLYGIAYTQGVRVYDISTPAQPMLLGSSISIRLCKTSRSMAIISTVPATVLALRLSIKAIHPLCTNCRVLPDPTAYTISHAVATGYMPVRVQRVLSIFSILAILLPLS